MSTGSGLFSKAHALKAHLLQGSGGLSAEVADVRHDVLATLSPMAGIYVEEYTNPVTGGVADLLVATATTVAIQTVTSFLAPGIAKLAALPRNVTFTTAGVTPAHAPASVVVTGTYRGLPQTETVTLAQTAAIALGVKPFSTITSVVYAAGDGTAATVSIGVGDSIGIASVPKARTGIVVIIKEWAIGAVVTTGALSAAGLYTPAAAPNGTNDYAIMYEADATA